ncbi:MAG: glycosyl transferase [Solobacterium sp.]|nr:glycosyl transferase [Solobacterium sp.]
MIPKIIHYCWFGHGEMNKKAQKCIESWKKYCPDYQIIEWNEENVDVYQNDYTTYLYNEKKYAFLSDYVRLQKVYEYGGLYFDVDVEAVRSFDDLLKEPAFFGFETNEYVNTGMGFGAEKGNKAVYEMLREYDTYLDGRHGYKGCPKLNTAALIRMGLKCDGSMQRKEDYVVFPAEYFNPYDDPTGTLSITENTYSIHWYAKSWMPKSKRMRSVLTKPLHKIMKSRKKER